MFLISLSLHMTSIFILSLVHVLHMKENLAEVGFNPLVSNKTKYRELKSVNFIESSALGLIIISSIFKCFRISKFYIIFLGSGGMAAWEKNSKEGAMENVERKKLSVHWAFRRLPISFPFDAMMNVLDNCGDIPGGDVHYCPAHHSNLRSHRLPHGPR